MMRSLEKRIKELQRKRTLQRRLNKVRICYFEHEDQGKLEKHNRVVNLIIKAIRKVA